MANPMLAIPERRDQTDAPERFELVREIGRGGMAVVYLARDRDTGHECAVKVIHSRFLGDAEAVARFTREARLTARLRHPNIVPVHSVESLGESGLALVMDRVPGRTVKQIIRDHGPMPPDRVQRVLDDIAAALDYAHAQGVIHRDVKPENIFVDETSGRALLSDFGIARSIHGDTNLTLAGVAIGTPTYMAPEQIDGAESEGRSDLYSLGLVGWEMLTGRRPWDGDSLYRVLYRQKHDELEPIDSVRTDVPERLIAAVEGLLAKNPGERWQSASEFRAQLAATGPVVRRPRSAAADPAAADTVVFTRPAPPGSGERRRWTRFVPVTAGAALLVSTTILFARPQPNPAPQQDLQADIRAAERAPAPTPALPVHSRPASYASTAPAGPAGSAAGSPGPAHVADTRDDAAVDPPRASPAPSQRPVPEVSLTTTVVEPVPARAEPPPPSAPAAIVPRTVARRFSVVPGAAHTCALAPSGVAYCWGSDDNGQLGTPGRSSGPVPVAGGLRFAKLTAGVAHTCAITGAGSAYCWGSNDAGQLGDGSSAARATPVRVAGSFAFSEIAAGASHTCALTGTGGAYCWGSGARGQLGAGTRASHATPVAVAGTARFTALATGWNHTCALTADGAAYCWGANDGGQLGDGSTTDRTAPVPVRTSMRFVAITAGSAHTCALAESGAAYCWGRDSYGQLGDGRRGARMTPVPVATGVRFTSISAGGVHTCAVARDNAAWCWGRDSYGQLGDGATSDRTTPVPVAGGHSFASVRAFGAHTCGTTLTNELFCWGYNMDGQLGDGTREHRTRPVYVEKPDG